VRPLLNSTYLNGLGAKSFRSLQLNRSQKCPSNGAPIGSPIAKLGIRPLLVHRLVERLDCVPAVWEKQGFRIAWLWEGREMVAETTLAGLAGGLATKLLTSGIQRAGSLAFQKAMRVTKIEQAIRGQAQRNSNVKAAMNDFEVVIGTRFGEYTVQLAKFLEELERSGLITTMVEDALLDRGSPEVQSSFEALFARAFPSRSPHALPKTDDVLSGDISRAVSRQSTVGHAEASPPRHFV
jgi:hypothetical protein